MLGRDSAAPERGGGTGRTGNLAAKSAPPPPRPPNPHPHPEARSGRAGGCVLPSTGAGAGGREPRGRGPSELPERERRRPGARGGRRRAGQRRYGSPRRPPMLPAGPAAATAAAESQREGGSGHLREEGGERRGAREGKSRAREERETAPREINRHMTVAIRRRPPTAGASAGEPGKTARRGHTCRRSTYPL